MDAEQRGAEELSGLLLGDRAFRLPSVRQGVAEVAELVRARRGCATEGAALP